MKSPLEIINGYGVSSTSYIDAIRQFSDDDRPIILTKEQYEQGIADIVGAEITPSYSNEKEARLYFLYTVQETIRAFQGNTIPDMDIVWEEAARRASTLISKSPWTITEYSTGSYYAEPKMDANGKPKKKKGAKKQEATALYLELNDGTNDRPTIIAALIDQVGLSKAGATTYFHNLKADYGFAGPETPKPVRASKSQMGQKVSSSPRTKRRSKLSIAREVYTELEGSPKSDIVAEIVKRSGTTLAGANTYYCACKKELV